MRKMERIEEIFAKIKEGHRLWVEGDGAYKIRLEKAFEPFFIELEQLGVPRHFTEALLFFGKEFTDSFDVISPKGLPPDQDFFDQPDIVKDAENIFGAKAQDMTDREIREAELAETSGALTWRSMPMKGDQVGIKILTYKKK